jgi:hypothetical protein
MISVISWVIVRSTPPIRRVVVNLEPTLDGRPSSMRTLTTSSCHSANREGSVTYEKTSSGGRAISMLDTIGGIVAPSPRHIGWVSFVTASDGTRRGNVTDGPG